MQLQNNIELQLKKQKQFNRFIESIQDVSSKYKIDGLIFVMDSVTGFSVPEDGYYNKEYVYSSIEEIDIPTIMENFGIYFDGKNYWTGTYHKQLLEMKDFENKQIIDIKESLRCH